MKFASSRECECPRNRSGFEDESAPWINCESFGREPKLLMMLVKRHSSPKERVQSELSASPATATSPKTLRQSFNWVGSRIHERRYVTPVREQTGTSWFARTCETRELRDHVAVRADSKWKGERAATFSTNITTTVHSLCRSRAKRKIPFFFFYERRAFRILLHDDIPFFPANFHSRRACFLLTRDWNQIAWHFCHIAARRKWENTSHTPNLPFFRCPLNIRTVWKEKKSN